MREAYDSLRNTLWMLAIPLAIGVVSLIGGINALGSELPTPPSTTLPQVPETPPIPTMPSAANYNSQPAYESAYDSYVAALNEAIRAEERAMAEFNAAVDRYNSDTTAYNAELYDYNDAVGSSYLFIPGLLPLGLVVWVMFKIRAARRALENEAMPTAV